MAGGNGASVAQTRFVTLVPNSGGFVVGATSSGFTAGANGNIDGDTACDHWFMNDLRSLQNPNNDVSL